MTEFSWPVRVYYEDTDAGGVVYYANYLKFLERARTEMLRHFGFEQDQLIDTDKIVFIVRKVTIDYLKPAFFNEQLTVTASITELRKVSILFLQTILNQSNECLCQAEILVACVDNESLKPVLIPNHILAELDHVN